MVSNAQEKKMKKKEKEQAQKDLEGQMSDLEKSAERLNRTEMQASILEKLKDMVGDKHKKLGGVNFEAPVSLIDLSQNHREIDTLSEEFIALKESIHSQGLIQRPIVAISNNIEQPLLCIAGHRRIQALKELGQDKIPVIIGDYKGKGTQELARLAENVVRKNLKPIELAEAVYNLKEQLKETNSGVARILDKHRGYIIILLKIATWPDHIKTLIKDNDIGMHFLNKLAKKSMTHEQIANEIRAYITSNMSNSSTPAKSHSASFSEKNQAKMVRYFEENSLDGTARKYIEDFLHKMKIRGWYSSKEEASK